jgi:hypothetical protein
VLGDERGRIKELQWIFGLIIMLGIISVNFLFCELGVVLKKV